MEISETAEVAALLAQAWVLIGNAGWDNTPRPRGWQDASAQWKAVYEAWLAANGCPRLDGGAPGS